MATIYSIRNGKGSTAKTVRTTTDRGTTDLLTCRLSAPFILKRRF